MPSAPERAIESSSHRNLLSPLRGSEPFTLQPTAPWATLYRCSAAMPSSSTGSTSICGAANPGHRQARRNRRPKLITGFRRNILPRKRLRSQDLPATLEPCRFTSFIARSARKTVKCWSVQATGREHHVPVAARPNWPRNFPSLPQRTEAETKRWRARVIPGTVVCAARGKRIRTEQL